MFESRAIQPEKIVAHQKTGAFPRTRSPINAKPDPIPRDIAIPLALAAQLSI